MTNNWNWTKNEQQDQQKKPRNDVTSSRNNDASSQQGSRNFVVSPMSYFEPLSHFYQDFDRMCESVFRNFGLSSNVPSIASATNTMMKGMNTMMQAALFNPTADISSTEREYNVEMELPGISENDIRIDVTRDGQLCICGEKRLENTNQDKNFHRVERNYGTFSRTISLPEDADQENIEARFENGVLTVTVPRLESYASQGRRVEIKAEKSGEKSGDKDGDSNNSERNNRSDRDNNNNNNRQGQEALRSANVGKRGASDNQAA